MGLSGAVDICRLRLPCVSATAQDVGIGLKGASIGFMVHGLLLACVYGGPLSIGHLRFCKYLHTWVGFGIDIFHTVYRGYCWYKPNRGTLMLW